MHQEDNYTNSFHRLVPDCRNLIFEYILYEFTLWDRVDPDPLVDKSTQQRTLDFNFALNHFKCHTVLDEYDDSIPLPKHLYSLKVCAPYIGFGPRDIPPSYFQNCSHLVELIIQSRETLKDEMFQYFESLEILHLHQIKGESLTDNLFTHLKHLRQLMLSNCWKVTDQAFENLYNAGSRLEKLGICNCNRITDQAFSFFERHSLRELEMVSCDSITGEGLKHLRGVETLTLWQMDNFNCHEAFKCLEGSVQCLCVCKSEIPSFDDKGMSYLKGIIEFSIYKSQFANLSESSFRHLAGSIKQLEVNGMWKNAVTSADNRLLKNILWHLSGIKDVNLRGTGIWITEEDLPRLKQVFSNIVKFVVSSLFADESILKELEIFIEGNGGRLVRVKE